ncbi:MAG: HAMP domain-containing sensor histidine kinase [Candidatus Obscuribacterales bacterium]
MKIWQKTLILALIPISLNAYGVFLMQDAIGRLGSALQLEQTEANAFRLLNRLYVSLVSASGLYSGYLSSGATDSKRLKSANETFATAKDCLKQIRKQAPHDQPVLSQGLDTLENSSIPALELLRNDCLKMDNQSSGENKLFALYQLKPVIKQASRINDIFTAVVEDADKKRQIRIAEQSEIVQRIRFLIFSCLFFNIAFSAVAIYFFRRSLFMRLQVILSRSKALADLEDVGPALSGVDEFAEIDNCIVEARTELVAAENFRSQVVAMVAHDMRSPLTSALTSLEMMEEKFFGPLTPETEKKVVSITASLNRLVLLIDEFLDLDKLRRKELELEITEFSLNEMIVDVVASLEAMAATIGVAIEVSAPSFIVSADKNRMRQVLTNLLSNAIKFSYKESTILVSAKASAKYWSLSVIDHGKGLSEEAKRELFQPYSRSEASSLAIKGSGLGLFICRWFTEAHGGKLEAKANKDEPGTTFCVTVSR